MEVLGALLAAIIGGMVGFFGAFTARNNYFSVYEGSASNLGSLEPSEVTEVVMFYGQARMLIDTLTDDGGRALGTETPEGQARQYKMLADQIDALVVYGEDLARRLDSKLVRDRIADSKAKLQIGQSK